MLPQPPRDLAAEADRRRSRRVATDRSRARRVARFVAEAKAAYPCESRVTTADYERAAAQAEAAGDAAKAAMWRRGAELCRRFESGVR